MISADDGNRYSFGNAEWKADGTGKPGDLVDFHPDGAAAADIYTINPAKPVAVSLEGTFNPLRKIYKFIGISLIVGGVLMTLTVILAGIGIPMIIFGLVLVFVAPKFLRGVERGAGDVLNRARDASPRP